MSHGAVDTVVAKGCEEGHGLPATVWNDGWQALAAGRHPNNGAMLVLVQVSSMNTRRAGSMRPDRPSTGCGASDVRSIALTGDQRLL